MNCDQEPHVTLSYARSAPRMFVVHKSGSIIARTEDAVDSDVRAEIVTIAPRLGSLIKEIEAGASTAVERLNHGRCLRVCPLIGLPDTYAVFFERVRQPITASHLVARYTLSFREAEVVTLLARGASSHEIAEALGIAETTVVSHIRNAGIKLGCTKRSSIVARLIGVEEEVSAS